MHHSLAGKVAIVTGASRGIGKSIALELANAGARVACVATSAENATPVRDQITDNGHEAEAFGCRVEQAASVTQLFDDIRKTLGPCDLLINNAGISAPEPTLTMSEENWDLHMDINCKSIFLCSQAAAFEVQ